VYWYCSASDSERGQSSANDPVTISPAGSYVPITTSVVETLLSMSLSPEGMVPSENSRLPDPLTRGEDPQAVLVDKIVAQQRQHATPKTQKRMSSIFTPYWAMAPRSCASGDCSRGKLSATVGGTWESARIYESRHTTKKVGVLGSSVVSSLLYATIRRRRW
jgi:hypothetical protein